jgi:hypothetical protein
VSWWDQETRAEAVDVEVSKGDDAGDVTVENRVLIPLLGVECGGRKEDMQEKQRRPMNHFDNLAGGMGCVYEHFLLLHLEQPVMTAESRRSLRQSSESKPT